MKVKITKDNLHLVNLFIFLGFLVYSLQPLIQNDYFLTQDSPSHLYNGKVFMNLILQKGETINNYYTYHFNLSPNFLSTAIYGFFSWIFSTKLAYQFVHLLIWVLFPFSIYYVSTFSKKENGFLAILSIPLLYTFPFILGFDSFCLGTSFALFLFGWWLRQKTSLKGKKFFVFSLLCVCLYFTHLVSVCFFLILVFLQLFIGLCQNIFWQKKRLELENGKVILPFLPVVFLLGFYFFTNPSTSSAFLFSSTAFDLNKLIRMDDLILFWSAEEMKLSYDYGKLFAGLLGLCLILQIWNKEFKNALVFWGITFSFFILYFITPDALAGGSMISSRIMLFFYVVVILLLSKTSFHSFFKYSIILVSLYYGHKLYANKAPYFERFNKEITSFMSVLKNVEEHSTLLYLNYHASGVDEQNQPLSYGKGLFHHAACFIAYQKEDVVLLKNYETYHSYFPIKWKEEQSANIYLSCSPYELSATYPCADLEEYNAKIGRNVDYIFQYKHPSVEHKDEKGKQMNAYIEANYVEIIESQNGILSLLKKRE